MTLGTADRKVATFAVVLAPGDFSREQSVLEIFDGRIDRAARLDRLVHVARNPGLEHEVARFFVKGVSGVEDLFGRALLSFRDATCVLEHCLGDTRGKAGGFVVVGPVFGRDTNGAHPNAHDLETVRERVEGAVLLLVDDGVGLNDGGLLGFGGGRRNGAARKGSDEKGGNEKTGAIPRADAMRRHGKTEAES